MGDPSGSSSTVYVRAMCRANAERRGHLGSVCGRWNDDATPWSRVAPPHPSERWVSGPAGRQLQGEWGQIATVIGGVPTQSTNSAPG